MLFTRFSRAPSMLRIIFLFMTFISPSLSFVHKFARLDSFGRLRMSNMDVNAYTDSKRRLQEAQLKISANMAPTIVDYSRLVEKIKDLELQSCEASFWDDQHSAHNTLEEASRLKATVARIDSWKRTTEDICTLLDMISEDAQHAGERLDPIQR